MHAEMCQALANEHRLAIMYALKDGEKCVGDIATEIGISIHNVSQHLRGLRQRLLVRPRKEGQTVYYSVTNPKFVQACALIRWMATMLVPAVHQPLPMRTTASGRWRTDCSRGQTTSCS